MAPFDYARARSTAERLIAKFGQVGAIRRMTASGPSYDPTLTPVDYPCTLVDLDIDERTIDGTLIMRGDRMVYLSTAGLGIVPELSDKVMIGDVEHAVVSVQPLQPAGTVVMWQIIARK
ncbi:hypothetical protein SAMN05892877_117147 [Rhizobium subbaraonis]|uniref:Uncharacterized protein n=1 Tax=Rhizobium subbaraonis TaxID=908946 RepID=A0A285UWN9_9HYPH|nr:hypothetical protein [Rhizobium subbaraonis]SOC45758.1 hypothetical protein SAMN05892877_117147 [Rhizobium subbaraonis]